MNNVHHMSAICQEKRIDRLVLTEIVQSLNLEPSLYYPRVLPIAMLSTSLLSPTWFGMAATNDKKAS
jgi:hypothetical protein